MYYCRNFCDLRINTKYSIRYFSNKVHLQINPLKCLHDEPVHITAINIPPGSNVTLVSTIQDTKGNSFIANAHFRSDEYGTIDLLQHPSLDGSYKGLFPMGPIAALHPAPNVFKYQRFINRDVTVPLIVNFKLLKGHLNEEEAAAPDPNSVLDSAKHERIYMAEKATRIPVREGRLRGTLFIPEGEGPFPGVIDLFGTAGGLIEFRAAQLASRGIASLSLAYFGFEDLPREMNEIDLTYFEEGVDYLHNYPKVTSLNSCAGNGYLHSECILAIYVSETCTLSNIPGVCRICLRTSCIRARRISSLVKKSGVGAIGSSKGADIVCSMAAYLPKVKAVVSINGIAVNSWCPMKYKDLVIPGLAFRVEKAKFLGPDLISSIEMSDDSEDYPETHIPMHKSKAEFLFICSKDDANWKTVIETERAVARMKANGKTNYELIKYDGAGHLVDPCYAPFSSSTFHKMANCGLFYGGNVKDHSAAQVDSWRRIIELFKKSIIV
ncbi:Acyl-coenzyme A thioesterase 4 [Armadillidium vulgare]|nr:Acyl-coenzyme A thioesterase 4 [Armadillidium vulgare]